MVEAAFNAFERDGADKGNGSVGETGLRGEAVRGGQGEDSREQDGWPGGRQGALLGCVGHRAGVELDRGGGYLSRGNRRGVTTR